MRVTTTKVTDGPSGLRPVGADVSHPDAWRLVQLGVAVPADKECEETLAELEAINTAAQSRRDFVAEHRAEIAAAQLPQPVAESEALVAPADVSPEADTELENGG